MKRILILSDFHSGHMYGLAHPSQCDNKFQKKGWDFFEKGIRLHSPFDYIFCNGDMIDGRGVKNKGVELLTTNLEEQCDMVLKVLRNVVLINKSKPKFYFTRGTPYHTGEAEDWENIIARDFKNEGDITSNIDETLLIEIEGVVFDLKHKIGSSAQPQTRVGAPAREIVQAMLKENYQDRPKADVFVRSHVHYHTLINLLGRIAFTTPALQINSSYGQRQCSGSIDYGFMVVDVDNGKVMKISPYICRNPIKQDMVIKG